jgi:hypothetical protein
MITLTIYHGYLQSQGGFHPAAEDGGFSAALNDKDDSDGRPL